MGVQLKKIDGNDVIVDEKGKIVIGDISNLQVVYRSSKEPIFQFLTRTGEYSFINKSGLFFDKYSYKEYTMVSELTPSFLKLRKGDKYGILKIFESGDRLPKKFFDGIEYLDSNKYCDSNIVKVKVDNRYFLLSLSDPCCKSDSYDYIYTLSQPLDFFLVLRDGMYGMIDTKTFKEYFELEFFNSFEEFCEYKYINNKYFVDFYSNKAKLDLQTVVDSEKNRSYYIDKNNILKGKWGGKQISKLQILTNEPLVYLLYYNCKYSEVPINNYGFFYNIFDARIYDAVFYVCDDLYITIIHGKYGLIDDRFHIFIPNCFENIEYVKFLHVQFGSCFIVKSSSGCFIYDIDTRTCSCLYEELLCRHSLFGPFRADLVYKEKGKYGLVSSKGEIILKAKYDLFEDFGLFVHDQCELGYACFSVVWHEKEYPFFIYNKKFYGLIPMESYDMCIRIGTKTYYDYFIVKLRGKYGIVNRCGERIPIPFMDDFIFYHKYPSLPDESKCLKRYQDHEPFFIGCHENKYDLYHISNLYDVQTVTTIISDCDEMNIHESVYTPEGICVVPFVHYKKNGIEGCINHKGIIVNLESFDEIKPILVETQFVVKETYCFVLVKDGKQGLADDKYDILLPCNYDEILRVSITSATVVLNGLKTEIKINLLKKKDWYDNEFDEELD